MKATAGILAIFISIPIWFFLLYKILEFVNATDLMWFLYWIYVPVTLTVHIISKLAEGRK